jgi:hypothetical protein
MVVDKLQVKKGHKRPQLATILPGKLLRVSLSLIASGQYICSSSYEGESLCELGLKLHNLGQLMYCSWQY